MLFFFRSLFGMDLESIGEEKAQALHQIPNARTRKGISLQRLRLQAETVGIGAKFEFNGASGENLVPKSANEREKAASSGAHRSRRWHRAARRSALFQTGKSMNS